LPPSSRPRRPEIIDLAEATTALAFPLLRPLEDTGAPASEVYYALMVSPAVELPPSSSGAVSPDERSAELQATLRDFAALAVDEIVVKGGIRSPPRLKEVDDLVSRLGTTRVVAEVDGTLHVSRRFLCDVWSLSLLRVAVEHELVDPVFVIMRAFPSPVAESGTEAPVAVRLLPAAAASASSSSNPARGAGADGGPAGRGDDDGGRSVATPRTVAVAQDAVCPSCVRGLLDSLASLGRRADSGLRRGLLDAGSTDNAKGDDPADFDRVRRLLVSLQSARGAFALAGVADWPSGRWDDCTRCGEQAAPASGGQGQRTGS
jgi:hypothetical protein